MPGILEVLIVTLIAGGATGIGGLFGICIRGTCERVLGLALGFASGVMIVIAFMSLFFVALEMGTQYYVIASFLLGALMIVILDIVIPEHHIAKKIESSNKKLLKAGILITLGMGLHNIPEGAAVGIGYSVLPVFGIMLALAIAIHNIPEGFAVSVPLRASGMRRRKIIWLTFLSGMTEPLGALVALSFLSFMPHILPMALGFTGGVMAYLAIDELIPVAKEYGNPRAVSIGIILGMGLAMLLETIL